MHQCHSIKVLVIHECDDISWGLLVSANVGRGLCLLGNVNIWDIFWQERTANEGKMLGSASIFVQ